MEVLWFLIQVLVLCPAVVRTWDVIVASEGHLNTLTATGEIHEINTPTPVGSSVSVAMSPSRDKLYLSDSNHPNASLLSLDIASGKMEPLVPKQSGNILGLALDPLNNVVYWTTGYGHSILKASIDGHSDYRSRTVKTVHKFRDEMPQGIAIDSCGRYLFWTNTNRRAPSIERSNLDGSNRTVIVTEDLYVPVGIAVDQIERKLYWTQELGGIYYSIERSDLDGSNREVMRSTNHQPYTLAIGTDYIYWADWTHNAIWRKDKNHLVEGSDPLKVYALSSAPHGVVAYLDGEAKTDADCRSILSAHEMKKFEATTIITTAATDDITEADWNDGTVVDDEFCLNSGAILKTKDRGPVCRCLPGYTGVRCETEICFNFCVHGVCSMDNKRGFATCICEPGFSGDRCEQNLCSDFCLNDGHCHIVNSKPSCTCHDSFKGERCEISNSLSKLCQIYCESDIALVPVQSSLDVQSLCVCSPEGKKLNTLNETAYVVPNEMSQMSLKKESSVIIENNLALLIVFGCICLLLLLAVILLTYKVLMLRKRPRIKKRFIGSKTVTPTPLTNRPSPATDQCEINIENCCNMNICETPCFEPNLRTSRPGSKKEEKKTLLDSMENSQGGSHDDLY
ncbi:protein cueball [Frankliniella occidentalis]|uniref:Protein cueball n=1 Tax=Frankliniella occidentalis TaxID=133901 RepID=A0A6J1TPY4_FRAOC|nr:protein cueball [Frankliniella occidentalis]